MKTVVAVFSKNAYGEYILPQINNSDHRIYMDKDYYTLKDSYEILFEVSDCVWRILPDSSYRISHKESRIYSPMILKDKQILMIRDLHGDKVYLMISEQKNILRPFVNFDLKGIYEIIIGSSRECDIVYTCNNIVSKRHAMIKKEFSGFFLYNFSGNGTYVNNIQVREKTELSFGDYINILGLKMLFLRSMLSIDVREKNGANVPVVKLRRIEDTSPADDETVLKIHEVMPVSSMDLKKEYQISSKNMPVFTMPKRVICAPPFKKEQDDKGYFDSVGPAVTMMLPMMAGYFIMIYGSAANGDTGNLTMYAGILMIVLSALVSAYWAIRGTGRERKKISGYEQKRVKAYERYLLETEEGIISDVHSYKESLEQRFPDTGEFLKRIRKPGALWWADPEGEDYLTIRVGTGNILNPAEIEIPEKVIDVEEDPLLNRASGIRKKYEVLKDVPITIDLKDHRRVCLLTQEGITQEALLLIAGFITGFAYTKLKIVLVFDERKSCYSSLKYLRWVPHLWSDDRNMRYMITDEASAGPVGYELAKIFRKRDEEGGSESPWYMFFVFSPELIYRESIWNYLTKDTGIPGYTLFLISDRKQIVPAFIQMIIESEMHGENGQGQIKICKSSYVQKFIYDSFKPDYLKEAVKYLAGLKMREENRDAGILDRVSFLNLYGIKYVEELAVEKRWKKNRTYEHIDGILGIKTGGKLCILDMHERYHGPHGLIAGTTGSGKSETLQTYILSLAIHFSPEDIAFFLIDYKGGGMAHLFEGLPHMAGEISNLSGSQIRRAMISIKSENRRRQSIFREHDVNNINAYTKAYKAGEVTLPVPHLFIIVDEFAELKREEPEFLQELISVAQVGRSLGVHLILSTQKPSGTVDDNIWSNSRFHICLRVQNTADSMDMLHKPDAAAIQTPGRGYLQVGNDEVYELFQSGYSGASYEIGSVDYSELLYCLGLSGQKILLRQEKKKSEEEVTQLTAVKEYLKKTAMEAGIRQPLTLWMPELRREIFYEELNCEEKTEGTIRIPLGMTDDVKHQRQSTYSVSLEETGHMAIIGSVSSGKSSLAETIVYAILSRYSPKEVNLYMIDYNSHKLSSFREAPQVGGIVLEYDDINLKRMLFMIRDEFRRRKKLLQGGSFLSYLEKNPGSLPYILLVVDGFAAFKTQTSEEYEDLFIELSKEGLSCGIYLLLTGAGFGFSDISMRIADNISTVIPLQLNDRFEYMEYFHIFGLELQTPPGIPGRGMVMAGEEILEFQAALSLRSEGDFERIELLKDFSARQKLRYEKEHAPMIPVIPERVLWNSFMKLKQYQDSREEGESIIIGYDGELGSLAKIQLSALYCLIIWGSPKSGKTNLLHVLIRTVLLKKREIRCYILDGDDRSLSGYEQDSSVIYAETFEKSKEEIERIIEEFIRRNKLKNRWIDEGAGDRELFRRMNRENPIFVFIADLKGLLEYLKKFHIKTHVILVNIMQKGSLHNIYFVGEAEISDAYSLMGDDVFEAMVSYQSGIHMGKKANENSHLLFRDMSYEKREQNRKPGQGILSIGDHRAVPVVIPEIREG